MTALVDIPAAVATCREGFRLGVLRGRTERRAQLRQLRRLLVEREGDLAAALFEDLGKPEIEAYGAEIGLTVTEIDHALDHLDQWMADEKIRVPIQLRPGSARVVRQPKGVVAIIGPWNYPVQLILAPLVAALAAGNTAVVKPSELAPATSAALAKAIPAYLDERAVQVVTGGVEETTALLTERFDHILYTGNADVGRIVLEAAAKHLTPVTLELGGKSPAIVLADADLDVAARRIAWGKFLNAGQTCIAPDYVLVEEAAEDRFLGALLRATHDFYGDDPATTPDFARIVNVRHHDRLTELLDAGGYEAVVAGGHGDRERRYFPPTVLAGVSPEAAVMQQEIFGPILPVLTVTDADAAVSFVNARPHPLALYLFSGDSARTERIVERTTSGGVAINATMLHVVAPDLPFGGIGASGSGAYHGEAGFLTFTHRRSVLDKAVRPDPPVLYPPYKSWKQKILRRLL